MIRRAKRNKGFRIRVVDLSLVYYKALRGRKVVEYNHSGETREIEMLQTEGL